MHDDIRDPNAASESEDTTPQRPDSPHSGRRAVGPESETRGGPDAPDEALDDEPPEVNPNPGLGHRAALPEGSLPGPYFGPQGDENRNPPANAPAPVNPQPTVETARRAAAGEKEKPGRT